jgi:hypothetical protein
MIPNRNIPKATITPPIRSNSAPAAGNNNPNGRKFRAGSDPKPAAKLKLDARLESIHDMIESQSTVMQITLSDNAVAMLLSTKILRDKRAGFVNLTDNESLIPPSCNIQAKLAFPQEMKEDARTIENILKWDDLIKKTREELKKQIIKQGHRTIKILKEK